MEVIIKYVLLPSLTNDAMVRKRIEEVMQEKGITKAEFSRRWGCLPQNVNSLLETDNLSKLTKIAEMIGCNVADFITTNEKEPQPSINGYIEYNGEVYTIKCLSDLNNLMTIIDKSQQQ